MDPSAIANLLPKAICHQIVHTLRGLLPPPVTSAPEDEARRDLAAIAHIASLLPANPEEANLATHYVAAGIQALECLRLARQYPDNPTLILKCTAQAASMMRQARHWRALLLRVQAARQKPKADTTESETARQTERRALGEMAEALAEAQSAPAEPPKPSPIAEAESYALHHRKRAVLIRRLGRVPHKLNIGPIKPEVVHAIVTGTTPALLALDDKPRRVTALAA